MADQNIPFYALNRGEISTLALLRVDLERLKLSAEEQINWLPRPLGPMMLRPGTEYISDTENYSKSRTLPFVFGANDTAWMEFTDLTLRPMVNEAPITRSAVSTTIPPWTGVASTGSTVTLGTTIEISGVLAGSVSYAYSTLTIAPGDQATEHGFRIDIGTGPVTFYAGTTLGSQNLFQRTILDDGEHSLAFTPNAGTVYIHFESTSPCLRVVSTIGIESAGRVLFDTEYTEADLPNIRYDTSADVMFLACSGYQPRKIVRSGARSYSFVKFKTQDGPFPSFAGDSSIKVKPSSVGNGNITITASKSLFRSGHVGALIRMFHGGQYVTQTLAAEDAPTRAIRVSGVSKTTNSAGTTSGTTDRQFRFQTSGTWVGTITVERSFESEDAGFNIFAQYTTNQNIVMDDTLDNVVCWYRARFLPGDYTSGSITVSLNYRGGGNYGVARITEYTDETSVEAETIRAFWRDEYATDWRLSEWSDEAGWPTAVALHEGRLYFGGNSKIIGSVSDVYDSFDYDKEGDAGPIQRTIGSGPVASLNWLLPMTRLMAGADLAIHTARSNSFDEPLTPTNFNMKPSITVGTSQLPAVRVDTVGLFVGQSGRRVYGAAYDVQISDYKPVDFTRLNPEICSPSIVAVAVQRQPEARIHFVRSDGTVAVFMYDKDDQVECWYRVLTDGAGGLVEDVFVLPGDEEDRVYYTVKRTINGTTRRYHERFSLISECIGGTISKCLDSSATYQGAATDTITGLDHLEGETVLVWADGKDVAYDNDVSGFTVTGGSITLPVEVENAVVGLGYTANFKSAKLAYAAMQGTAINRPKRVDHLGFVMQNAHPKAVTFGSDPDYLDDLPEIEDGTTVDPDAIHTSYDQQSIPFNGKWDVDSRIYIRGQAPRPVTILGVTFGMATSG